METPNPRLWSELPSDLLRSIFERLSFADFHRAKIVCSNWNTTSKQKLVRKSESPWLILFPKEDEDGSALLFNPEEEKIYRTKRDFSGFRFLANSGNWFLVVDSGFNLYIIDLFSENVINLPPLESIESGKRVEGMTIKRAMTSKDLKRILALVLRGRLWVDEKTQDYIVVWFFDYWRSYLGFCKKGDDHYNDIPLHFRLHLNLQGLTDAVLWGYRLYIYTTHHYIRILDLSGQQGFNDVTGRPLQMFTTYGASTIMATTSGEVMFIKSVSDFGSHKRFRLFKQDPDADSIMGIEVESLGDDGLLVDLGITVPGIEPNSIYFTCHEKQYFNLDICVFNLETKTFKRFPSLSNMELKGARWFLPRT